MKGNYVPVLVFFAGVLLLLFATTAEGRAIWGILTGKVKVQGGQVVEERRSFGVGRSW